MNFAWLDELLPRTSITPRTRILWALFFVFFPLAFLGGIWLQLAKERPARLEAALDRPMSIKMAAQFAARKGFAVRGWHTYGIQETHNDLLSYYAAENGPDIAAARLLAPAREVQVLFRSPDYSEEFRVFLSLSGRITGYNFGTGSEGKHFSTKIGMLQVDSKPDAPGHNEPSPQKTLKPLPAPQAEALARSALAKNRALTQLIPQLGEPKVSTDDSDPSRTEFEWDVRPAERKELTLKVQASVRPSEVVQERIEAHIDNSYTTAHPVHTSKSPVLLNVAYGFFLTFAAFYALYRYARRTLQKEVSHARTLIVAGLFFLSYSVLTYSVAFDLIAVKVDAKSFMTVTVITDISSIFTIAAMGLLVGIGYSSGEGEVREAYPGKLTSLDAVLAGRIFSQNVAASVLAGAAAAGWLLLCHHAIEQLLPLDVNAARADALRYTFARLPWLALLIGKQYDSLLIAVAGLLVPASLLSRRGVRRKRRFVWLILFALLAVSHDAAANPSGKAELLSSIIFVAALLLPFFAFDLLAAMVSMSVLVYADALGRLSAVFPGWINFSSALALLVSSALAAAAWLALRGKQVREEEVRPKYAKNLAERMSLQAEVLAAREAQLRLLPQSPPELPGFQLAACCLPAREVGGDFYDFFRLDGNRIGIFVAQGGEQGLASALCIALAKGVLMHASQQPQSPTQIVLGLEESLVELLEAGSGAGICFVYAVVDIQRRSLNYARLGESPRLLIRHAGVAVSTTTQLEREVVLHGRPRNSRVYEGAAILQLGDYLILFTQGIASLRMRRLRSRDHHWPNTLLDEMESHEQPLQTALSATLTKYHRHAVQDLTAVILRAVDTEVAAREGVA